jgi:hypothetical protein
MKFGIDFAQPSTQRGAARLIIFVLGLFMAYVGKDITTLLLLGSGVNGLLGFAVKDQA